MQAEIKDKTKEIIVAIRAAGYSLDTIDVETILNLVDLIRENKASTTLKDVIDMQEKVKGLFVEV